MIFNKSKRCKIKKGSEGAGSEGYCYGYVDMKDNIRYAIVMCDNSQSPGLWNINGVLLQEIKWRDMQSVLSSL